MPITMIRNHIERVRERPKDSRKAYALGVAGATTMLIVGGWVAIASQTGYYALFGTKMDAKTQSASVDMSSAGQKFGDFKNEFLNELNNSPTHKEVNTMLQQYQQARTQAAGVGFAAGSNTNTSTTTSPSAQTQDNSVPDVPSW